jgi:hypothetical protein
LQRSRSVAPFVKVTVPAPDQCPDKPRNGPSEPGSAWACAETSKIADANSAEEGAGHNRRVCRVGPDGKLYIALGQPYNVLPL